MLGGGGNSFAGITFNQITFPGTIDATDNLQAANANGGYVISAAGADSFIITAYPASEGGVTSTTNATTGEVTYTVVESGAFLQATVRANSVQWLNNASLNAASGD